MSKPVLYTLDASPPCRAVLLTAAVIGVEFELRTVNLLEKDQFKEDYLKVNPQHTIPTLDDNGFILWDSHAIMCYLVDKYAKDDSLYPKDLQKRATIHQRLYFDTGVLFPTLRSIVKPLVIDGEHTIPKEKLERLAESYELLEKLLEGKTWLADDSYTLADISVVASIAATTVIKSLEKYPNISAWLKRCEEQLPFYNKFMAHGNNELHAMIRRAAERST